MSYKQQVAANGKRKLKANGNRVLSDGAPCCCAGIICTSCVSGTAGAGVIVTTSGIVSGYPVTFADGVASWSNEGDQNNVFCVPFVRSGRDGTECLYYYRVAAGTITHVCDSGTYTFDVDLTVTINIVSGGGGGAGLDFLRVQLINRSSPPSTDGGTDSVAVLLFSTSAGDGSPTEPCDTDVLVSNILTGGIGIGCNPILVADTDGSGGTASFNLSVGC